MIRMVHVGGGIYRCLETLRHFTRSVVFEYGTRTVVWEEIGRGA